MSSLSLSGKNWVLKKFKEEDIIYLKENFSFERSEIIIFEIRKPEITKNISTPNHPPLKISNGAWYPMTPNTETALRYCISFLN